jgi:alpha-glucosidase
LPGTDFCNAQPYLPGERAYYRVGFKGSPILTDSPLGLDFLGASPLDRDFEVVKTDRQSHDSTWENAFGAKRLIPDRYNELTVALREKRPPGRRLDLIFRAYNEGVAFRYFLPEQEAIKEFTLASENTGFYFAGEVFAYALNMGRFNTHNEGEYPRTGLNEIKPASIINLPLLVEVPGGPWVALLEADLADYAGMSVGGVPGVANALVSKLSPTPGRKAEQAVIGTTPKATPWRVLMVGPTPGRLIETNYLILNLNPPCARNVNFAPGMNTPTMKHYIDFAARHGLEYMLIDAGWYPMTNDSVNDDILSFIPEVNIPEILAHAENKGVKVILWVEWRPLDRKLDEALALYEKWGVAGIKVDYMNRDDQEMVNLYEKWVCKAAEHHLTVDFHGAYKPTGQRRTYPNLITQEGVMGQEFSKWSERVTPEYTVTIPFTRMLAGPMDFTPGAFRNAARGKFKPLDIEPMSQGTRAQQLAMYVVYESPLVMLADHPEAYENQPGIEFIEKVPTVWDETKVLQGEPGKFIVMARQKGEAWCLGAMTNWDARDLEIPLDFLAAGEYEGRIFADGPDADQVGTSLTVSTKRVTAADKLSIHLAPGGGLAAILTPA